MDQKWVKNPMSPISTIFTSQDKNLMLITKFDSNLKKNVQFFGYGVKMDKKHGISTNLRGIYMVKIQIHLKIDKNQWIYYLKYADYGKNKEKHQQKYFNAFGGR